MRMIICSLSELRKRHEATKEYECYNYLVETQKNMLETIEKSLTEKNQDDVYIESYEYDMFQLAVEPKESLEKMINMFGEDEVANTFKNLIQKDII